MSKGMAFSLVLAGLGVALYTAAWLAGYGLLRAAALLVGLFG